MSQILDDLPDVQVFARDPEQLSEQELQVVIERLRKLVARMRKARQDDAKVAELAAKFKKVNAAAAKKKAKTTAATDPMETTIT